MIEVRMRCGIISRFFSIKRIMLTGFIRGRRGMKPRRGGGLMIMMYITLIIVLKYGSLEIYHWG